MWFEPKRGLDWKHKINASVFPACLLICSKVPGDLRIFIGAPLMIQQLQKYPSSDATLPLTCQDQIRLSHQEEIAAHTVPSDMMSGVKRLRVRKAGDLTSLHHYRQHNKDRMKRGNSSLVYLHFFIFCLLICPFFCHATGKIWIYGSCKKKKSHSKSHWHLY